VNPNAVGGKRSKKELEQAAILAELRGDPPGGASSKGSSSKGGFFSKLFGLEER
jgi:hypothetical protein